MSKNKDQKRKVKLATKAKNEAFRFHVEFKRKQKSIDIMGMEQKLNAELDAICQNGLTEGMLNLAKIVEEVKKELGFKPETDKCSLNGALVPYILGITTIHPDRTSYIPGVFTAEMPLQVTIAYDNEYRNRVVDWVKAHFDGVTTRLGQPIIKLQSMVVEFKRVLKAQR